MREAAKRRRAALVLLPPLLAILASVLLGWGVGDLFGFFRNSARTALVAILLAAYLVGTLLGIEPNPFSKGQSQGRRWPLIFGISIVPFMFVAVSFFDRRNVFVFPGDLLIRWIGVAAFAIGEAIRLAALRELGRQYSAFLTIQAKHELIRTGPYRLVRHPFYLGTLLTAPGMMLVFRSPLSVIVFVLSIAFVLSRIDREEKLLLGEFPDAYSEYKRHSWRLLPRVY